MWDWLFLRWRLRQKAIPARRAIKPPAPAGSKGFSSNSSIKPGGSTGSGTGTTATLGLNGAEAAADAGASGAADAADAGGAAVTGTEGMAADAGFCCAAAADAVGGGAVTGEAPRFFRSLMFLVISAVRLAASLSARSLTIFASLAFD